MNAQELFAIQNKPHVGLVLVPPIRLTAEELWKHPWVVKRQEQHEVLGIYWQVVLEAPEGEAIACDLGLARKAYSTTNLRTFPTPTTPIGDRVSFWVAERHPWDSMMKNIDAYRKYALEPRVDTSLVDAFFSLAEAFFPPKKELSPAEQRERRQRLWLMIATNLYAQERSITPYTGVPWIDGKSAFHPEVVAVLEDIGATLGYHRKRVAAYPVVDLAAMSAMSIPEV